MSGCLEGYNAIASQLLKGLDSNDLITKLKDESNTQLSALAKPKPCVFHSTLATNPNPIITMKDGKFSAGAAMAIKDGKITFVGSYKSAKEAAGHGAEDRDLQGECIVPGFVEPHLHILLSALLEGFVVNLDPLSLNPKAKVTFDDTITVIQTEVGKLKKDKWFLGYGYDPSRLDLDADGHFQDLTFDVFKQRNLNGHPIFIVNASGHLAYANKLAFEKAGIKKNADNYVKDSNGCWTGVMLEPATYTPFLDIALPSEILKIDKFLSGLRQVVNDWSKNGFTTVFDAGVGQPGGSLYVDVLTVLSLGAPLHIRGAAANLDPDEAEGIVGKGDVGDGKTPLKIKTIKLWMDGSTQGFTAALTQPYNPDTLPSYLCKYGWSRWSVEPTCPVKSVKDHIEDQMLKWAERGYQLMVHVNGDCATEVVLQAFENVAAAQPNSTMIHRLEHFTVTTSDQVKRAKELNLSVSHTIGHVKYWGNAFSKYILSNPETPDQRAERIDPVKDDLDNGLVYSFHSDSPVSQADALSFVRTAATRIMHDGCQVLGPAQRVSVEAALAGVTINPAKQILLDSRIGSLEVGKEADFVILAKDISSPAVVAEDIDSSWIKETWYKGVQRYLASN
jgi:predicted amidohydrolase YtcJ